MDMLLSTAEQVPNRSYRVLGLVQGNTVRAKHVGHDILASLRNLVGGEVGSYTQLLSEARTQALERMIGEAKALGADAVVSVRFSTSSVAAGASEILAYGTAIAFE